MTCKALAGAQDTLIGLGLITSSQADRWAWVQHFQRKRVSLQIYMFVDFLIASHALLIFWYRKLLVEWASLSVPTIPPAFILRSHCAFFNQSKGLTESGTGESNWKCWECRFYSSSNVTNISRSEVEIFAPNQCLYNLDPQLIDCSPCCWRMFEFLHPMACTVGHTHPHTNPPTSDLQMPCFYSRKNFLVCHHWHRPLLGILSV